MNQRIKVIARQSLRVPGHRLNKSAFVSQKVRPLILSTSSSKRSIMGFWAMQDGSYCLVTKFNSALVVSVIHLVESIILPSQRVAENLQRL